MSTGAFQFKYKQVNLDCGYSLDIVVENKLILELKSVATLSALHETQLLTYMKLAEKPKGLLINFNSVKLVDGIIPMVNEIYKEIPIK